MSLRSKATKQDIPSQVQSFEGKLNKLRDAQSRLSMENTRKQAKFDMKQISTIASQITNRLSSYTGADKPEIEKHFNSLLSDFNTIQKSINEQIQKYEAQAAQEQEKKAAQQASQNAELQMQQQQIDQEAANAEFAARETKDIVEQMKNLKEITEVVNEKVQEQHEVVVRVDDKIATAADEMEVGNQELDEAKKNQAKCRI